MKTSKTSRSRRLRFVVVAAAGLAGCGTSGPTQLKQVADRATLVAQALLSDPSGPAPAAAIEGLKVGLTSTEAATCLAIGTASATLDAQTLGSSPDPSGWGVPDGLSGLSPTCFPAEWESKTNPSMFVDEDESTFELSDDSDTWTMTVQRLFALRSATRVSDATLHAGDVLQLMWSPATDTPGVGCIPAVSGNLAAIDGGFVTAVDGGVLSVVGAASALTYDAGAMGFTLPIGIAPGVYALSVSACLLPGISRCTGPAACGFGEVEGDPGFEARGFSGSIQFAVE